MLENYAVKHKRPYLCTVFFMVLDLRLRRLFVVTTGNFFYTRICRPIN